MSTTRKDPSVAEQRDAGTPSGAAASGSFWDDHNLVSSTDVRYWLGFKEIRETVNRRLTGDPELLFIEAFLRSFEDRWPFERALSVGCGTGELERGVIGLGAVAHFDGIDVSAESIGLAREAAGRESFTNKIAYFVSDATSWFEVTRAYDLVFFHGSLHHIEDLEGALVGSAQALRARDGLLYVDEYIGPSRDEWDEEHLGFAAGLFQRVPEADRRTPRVWPPIAMEDPTEMIRSSEIPACIERFFEIIDRRPYYGNVLMPLINAIKGTSLAKPHVGEIVREAIDVEAFLVERGLIDPLYSVFVARPRHAG